MFSPAAVWGTPSRRVHPATVLAARDQGRRTRSRERLHRVAPPTGARVAGDASVEAATVAASSSIGDGSEGVDVPVCNEQPRGGHWGCILAVTLAAGVVLASACQGRTRDVSDDDVQALITKLQSATGGRTRRTRRMRYSASRRPTRSTRCCGRRLTTRPFTCGTRRCALGWIGGETPVAGFVGLWHMNRATTPGGRSSTACCT